MCLSLYLSLSLLSSLFPSKVVSGFCILSFQSFPSLLPLFAPALNSLLVYGSKVGSSLLLVLEHLQQVTNNHVFLTKTLEFRTVKQCLWGLMLDPYFLLMQGLQKKIAVTAFLGDWADSHTECDAAVSSAGEEDGCLLKKKEVYRRSTETFLSHRACWWCSCVSTRLHLAVMCLVSGQRSALVQAWVVHQDFSLTLIFPPVSLAAT